MGNLSNYINILGLVCDIVGATGIYLIKIKGIEKINRIELGHILWGADVNDKIKGLHSAINDSINEADRKNKINDKKARKFFILIFMGFILQLVSSIPFLNNSNKISSAEAKHCKHKKVYVILKHCCCN